MHPILAALIPTILLGFCIAFLIVRLQNKTILIHSLKKNADERTPKIIRRDGTSHAPFEDESAAPAPKATPAPATADTPRAPQVKQAPHDESSEQAFFDSTDSLLATLSHELKTPLNGIMGIAQMLREENEDSEQLIELEGCANHMHSVLHTLTNLARIQNENEYLPQYREWISLRETIEQVREDVTFRANGRQLKLYTEHGDTRLRLRGDADHIETIIKSSILGSIEGTPMTGLPEEKRPLDIAWSMNDGVVELTITNPLEVLENERGVRVKGILNLARGSRQSRIKIEYLHIAVAQALLGFYQGSSQSETLPEGGVRTTLRFKMESMMASPSAAKPIGGLRVQSGKSGIKALRLLPKKMKVLVAEDDRASRNLLIMMLGKMGQEATEVENGEEAVLTLQKDPDYDVILMDVDMPIMDGVSATQAIRNGLAGDEVTDIPIVAVTAFNVISDRSRFKEAGMGYYLPKPVGLKELRATLLDIVQKKET